MSNIPKSYEVYKHFKGNIYQILVIAEHTETKETQVVYQGMNSPYKIYVRPLAMFLEKIDKEKYPDAEQEYRFEKIENKQIVTETKTEKEEVKSLPSIEENEENADYDAEEVLEPLLLDFLDSDTYEEKLNILVALHHRLTDEMVNTMAMALDVEINEGKLEDKYEGLKNCLVTLQRYECNRLR